MNKIFLLQCHKEIQLDFQYNVWSLRQIQSPLLGVGLQGLREIQRTCNALYNNNPLITPCIQCDPPLHIFPFCGHPISHFDWLSYSYCHHLRPKKNWFQVGIL